MLEGCSSSVWAAVGSGFRVWDGWGPGDEHPTVPKPPATSSQPTSTTLGLPLFPPPSGSPLSPFPGSPQAGMCLAVPGGDRIRGSPFSQPGPGRDVLVPALTGQPHLAPRQPPEPGCCCAPVVAPAPTSSLPGIPGAQATPSPGKAFTLATRNKVGSVPEPPPRENRPPGCSDGERRRCTAQGCRQEMLPEPAGCPPSLTLSPQGCPQPTASPPGGNIAPKDGAG